MEKLNKYKIYSVLEVILGILVIFQSVKKGGFYISDMDLIFITVIFITIIYITLKIIEKNFRLNTGIVLLIGLYVAYMLPVIFRKAADSNYAIWEAFKYLELLCIYTVVSNSSVSKRFEVILIITGIVIGIFGIDQISSRFLAPMLSGLNSGYLSTYLDRLSSTIQYANTAGIILTVSFLVCNKKLYEYIDKIQNDYNMKNVTITKYLFYAASFLFLCTILTQSRAVVALLIIGMISVLVVNRKSKNIFFYLLIDIVIGLLSFITTSIIDKYIYSDYIFIYLIVALFIAFLSIIFNILLLKVIMNIKIWYKLENTKSIISSKNVIICLIIIIAYFIIALNLTGSITLEANSKDYTYSKKIDLTNIGSMQSVEIHVKDLLEKSKYKLELCEVFTDNTEKILAEFNEFGSSDGIFSKKFNVDENVKNLLFKVNVEEGKIDISKINYNGNDLKLNYILIPNSLIERMKEESIDSTSFKVRIEYIKDAFKIFNTSKVVGRGGEAFRLLYKEVQTGNYISTEVHSSFIQILIESGIIGFVFIISFCVYSIIKGKKDEYLIIFIIFIFHSCFDLNFSYMISLMIFGIVAGILSKNKQENS